MDRKEKIIICILVLALLNLVMLFSYNSVVYSKQFYEREFEQNGVYAKYNKTFVDQENELILRYLADKDKEMISDNLSAQDKAHLADVKEIMDDVKDYSFVVVGIIFALFMYMHFRKRARIDAIFSASLMATGMLGLILLVALWALSHNFEWAFIKFHEMLFNNSLWMMDPAKDLLVNIYPEQFWIDAFGKIMKYVLIMSSAFIAIGGISWFIQKKKKHMDEGEQK